MEYLVILYVTFNNESPTKKAMYTYVTDTEAIATFHQQVGNYMKDTTVKHLMCVAMNTNCGILEECTWDRPET